MKIIIIVVFAVLSIDVRSQDWHAKWDSAGKTWNEKWTNTLDSLSSFSPSERMDILGSAVRIRSDTSNSERNGIFERAKSTLLSIPGHAEYFGKKIREAYEPLKGPDVGAVHGVQEAMMYGFGTLRNLPSPETVKVLGDMLSDTWRMKPPSSQLQFDHTHVPGSLAHSAVASALVYLPLRDPPEIPPLMAWDDPEVVRVHPWQNWYTEVKSGKRTFSFKGQNVEYRFKPDGTWETIAMANPPDDGPKPEPSKPEATRPEKSPPPSPTAPAPPASAPAASPSIYGWIIGGVILFLAAVAALLKRRHAS